MREAEHTFGNSNKAAQVTTTTKTKKKTKKKRSTFDGNNKIHIHIHRESNTPSPSIWFQLFSGKSIVFSALPLLPVVVVVAPDFFFSIVSKVSDVLTLRFETLSLCAFFFFFCFVFLFICKMPYQHTLSISIYCERAQVNSCSISMWYIDVAKLVYLYRENIEYTLHTLNTLLFHFFFVAIRSLSRYKKRA